MRVHAHMCLYAYMNVYASMVILHTHVYDCTCLYIRMFYMMHLPYMPTQFYLQHPRVPKTMPREGTELGPTLKRRIPRAL